MPRSVLQGEVVSDSADKTIVVRVDRRIKHPLYKKFIRRSNKFHAHDPENKSLPVQPETPVQTLSPCTKLKGHLANRTLLPEPFVPTRICRAAGA